MSALTQLLPRLITIAVLAVLFMFLTVAISLGWLNASDHDVLNFMSGAWDEQLHPLFQGIALLGGIELTSALMIALAVYLYRSGLAADAWVLVAFAAAEVFELFYKNNLTHPAPPPTVVHHDGPSITDLFASATAAHNSFPSGHMMRTVLVFGLLAFVIRRLAPAGWPRTVAAPAAIAIVVLMAFDRLYLDVHWESDVLGGLLLGAIGLVSATVWLDRPRRADN